MKSAGMPTDWLKGAGQLAACVRLIHGLRMGLNAGAVPIETSAVPVSMDDYARVAQLCEVWFQPNGDEAQPTPWSIYQQAVAVARMTSLPDVYEELPSLTELLSD